MGELNHIAGIVALTMGVAWASGINLYAAILVLGILGRTGNMVLPPDLQILMSPLVIGAAGLMYLVEFFADKVPGVDTAWDTLHTFIRIPAGALLAAGAIGPANPAIVLAAGILGGGMTALSHGTKAGSRVLINTSPEPFTNWAASVLEDLSVIGGLWVALHHPWLFIGLLILFVLFAVWLLPKIWKGVKKAFGFLGRWLGAKDATSFTGGGAPQPSMRSPPGAAQDETEKKLRRLNELLSKDLISREEYDRKKSELVNEAVNR